MPVAPNHLVPALMTSLVVWGMYRRVRRNIGRQPLQPRRLIFRIVIFSVISALFVFIGLEHPKVLLGFGGGVLPGALLALVGLRLTRFETTAEGRFYTPNIYIGVGLSLLLVARLAYRMILLYGNSSWADPAAPGLLQSPLTFVTFGLLAGYYIVYFIGVLLHSRSK